MRIAAAAAAAAAVLPPCVAGSHGGDDACGEALRRLAPPGVDALIAAHPRRGQTMTSQDVARGWAAVHAAQSRRLQDPAAQDVPQCRGGPLRVVYVTQAKNRSQVSPAYFEDLQGGHRSLIILEWGSSAPSPEAGTFHSRGLTLGEGRNAAQLVVLEQEMRQGWRWDYTIMLDDDVHFVRGGWETFERFLQEWQPAVGFPGFNCGMPSCRKQDRPDGRPFSTVHSDHILLGYRHDTHGLLWPIDTAFDHECGWASQFMQSLQMGASYPGYYVWDPSTKVAQERHNPYPRTKCLENWCKYSVRFLRSLGPRRLQGARCFRGHPFLCHSATGSCVRTLELLLYNASRGMPPADDECARTAADQVCKSGEARRGGSVSFLHPVEEGNPRRCGGVLPWHWPFIPVANFRRCRSTKEVVRKLRQKEQELQVLRAAANSSSERWLGRLQSETKQLIREATRSWWSRLLR